MRPNRRKKIKAALTGSAQASAATDASGKAVLSGVADGTYYIAADESNGYGIVEPLLVRGTRVPYVETEKEQQVSRQEESTWNQEYLHAIIVGMEWTAVGIGVVLVLTGLYRLLFKSKKGGGKA